MRRWRNGARKMMGWWCIWTICSPSPNRPAMPPLRGARTLKRPAIFSAIHGACIFQPDDESSGGWTRL
jgi:hypothetical protein